jgi:hypothetical protein
MRFCSDGPSIPDSLLEQRDQGRVVFLCGAGISMDFGMPNFKELTRKIIEEFNPPKESEILSAFSTWESTNQYTYKVPFDQIFHLLYKEYPNEEVNEKVEKIFKTDSQHVSKNHAIIRLISSDIEGIPQIVTTNFDRLFERDNEGTKIHEPPALPNLKNGGSISGITYLHGRLNGENIEEYPYVLSSADFGRAYLAEGWATHFIRSLIEMYTVVLVGYSADDPPVKYLLQGLNQNKRNERTNLFVFDCGEPDEIEMKWVDKGVTSIAYKDHPQLWETLGEWARRAKNPLAWRNSIIEKARTLPHLLDPHERGQVAHIVKTSSGAKQFADAIPPLPADWLWVFDSTYRTKEIIKNYTTGETFDPLENYGLDDDLPRDEDSKNGYNIRSLNLLKWLPTDENPPESNHLVSLNPSDSEKLPSRLFHLNRWIVSNLNDPITLYWASRNQRLHPRIVRNIEAAISLDSYNKSISTRMKQLWNLVLAHQDDQKHYDEHAWMELSTKIEAEGWSYSVLRDIEKAVIPRLAPRYHELNFIIPQKLKEQSSDADIKLFYELQVAPFHGSEPNIPDEYLIDILLIINNSLRTASRLYKELKNPYFDSISCYDNPSQDEDLDPQNLDMVFSWFLNLFKRLVKINPSFAKSLADTWATNEIYYLGKLKLFALNQKTLFSPVEVGKNILSLQQETFWDCRNQKEILFLVNDRWEELSQTNRNKIINRILQGPPEKETSSNPDYNSTSICEYARWLQLQGRKFTLQQEEKLRRLISSIKGWKDGWASGFLERGKIRSGFINTNESPERIINLPEDKVIEEVQKHTVTFPYCDGMTEDQPFIGLVKANPMKALSALILESNKGIYPSYLWKNLIDHWPQETDPEKSVFFLQTLSKLPEESIRNQPHSIGKWVEVNLLICYQFSPEETFTCFDLLVGAMNSQDGSANGSGVYQLGKKQSSRKTYGHATSGPIGEFTIGLLQSIDSLELKKEQGIPHEFKSRLETLVKSPNEGGFHAVTIITHYLNWIDNIDPNWTKEIVFPWFDFTHKNSEAAWHGFLSNPRFSDNIGMELKPYLPHIFPKIYTWNPDNQTSRIAAQIIVILSSIWKDKQCGLSSDQVMNCIRHMKEADRLSAVQKLRNVVKEENDWNNHVIPFIKSTWPKEMSLRTSRLSDMWIMLLTYSGNAFPELLKAVKRFLLPKHSDDYIRLSSFMREHKKEDNLTEKFPYSVLELLDAIIPEEVSEIPYGLQNILNLIIETEPKTVEKQAYKRLIRLIEMA